MLAGWIRYKWLHVTACVQPTSGEAVWFLSTGLSKPLFEALLASFAQQIGAGRERHVALAFLPPYSPERQPELQPAERLWPLVDEPVANRHLATLDDLDAIVAERCRRLDAATIQPHTDFHWWPKPVQPN